MPSFNKGPNDIPSPFGPNEYLRSTKGVRFQSYTCAASTVAVTVIDGVDQKILPSGMVMAKITSGPEIGKVGPYSADTVGVTDGRSVLANIVGLNDTFLPWQLMEHDEPISCAYVATAKQGWGLMLDAAGDIVPITDAVANAMRGTKGLDILFQ